MPLNIEDEQTELQRAADEAYAQTVHDAGLCDGRTCPVCVSLEMQREYEQEIMDDYNQSRM